MNGSSRIKGLRWDFEPLSGDGILKRVRARTVALIITACYALPTSAAIAYIWYHTQPGYHGMDWIGVSLLTFPGCGVALLFPHTPPNSVAVTLGLIVNSSGLYFISRMFSSWLRRS